MTEKMLTIRLDEQEHRALKLYAVLQGRSVNAVVTDLIRVELVRSAKDEQVRGHEEFAAELLARFGIDAESAEHRAAAERARAGVKRSRPRSKRGAA